MLEVITQRSSRYLQRPAFSEILLNRSNIVPQNNIAINLWLQHLPGKNLIVLEWNNKRSLRDRSVFFSWQSLEAGKQDAGALFLPWCEMKFFGLFMRVKAVSQVSFFPGSLLRSIAGSSWGHGGAAAPGCARWVTRLQPKWPFLSTCWSGQGERDKMMCCTAEMPLLLGGRQAGAAPLNLRLLGTNKVCVGLCVTWVTSSGK